MFTRVMSAVLLAGMAASANALQIQNGGFETGALDGWTVNATAAGTASVSSSSFGLTPTQGSQFALLTSNVTLSQQQSWVQGEQLIFDWAFATYEAVSGGDIYNDFALFSVFDINNVLVSEVRLMDVLGLAPGASSTDWSTYTYTFTGDGAGSVRFGVFDAIDTSYNSMLLLDNIRSYTPATPDVDPPPVTQVPEPGTLALFALGLAGLGLTRRLAAR